MREQLAQTDKRFHMAAYDDMRRGRGPNPGKSGYVPSTRAGRDEPRRTSIGSQSRGRRGPRPAKVQRKGSRHHGDQNYRTLTGLDTGYSLRGRRQQIDFDNRHRGLLSRYGISNRMLILGAAAVVIVLIAALSIASCVQGQPSEQPTQTHQEDTGATNQWDSRVSANTPKDLTSKFTTVLDRNEKFATIAKNADRYPDARLPELAINEPAAIDFVAAYPTAEHRATDYGQTNEKGEFPQLFNWDIRWGYVDYAQSVIGVTGSGPTSLAMAYMGLSNKVDKTPATFAADAESKGYSSSEDIATTGDLFIYEAKQLGLECKEYSSPSADTLRSVLSSKKSVAIVKLKANFDGQYEHWALAVRQNSDGSVTLHDPTSLEASSHTWDVGTIAANTDELYALSS